MDSKLTQEERINMVGLRCVGVSKVSIHFVNVDFELLKHEHAHVQYIGLN